MNNNPTFLIVDLFCGAGGTTTGFAMAERDGNKIAKVIACVNHDAKAIESHWRNHKEVKHFEEDIRTLDLTELIDLTHQQRLLYPDAKLVLWASLECTNFSKAKGGQPRDADSRTLADHLDRYILALNPDYVQIENVVEFMSWGPLDDKGKPVSRKSGSDWMRWKNHIDSLGYHNEWKELNSADFGAYTSRNRLFGCFAKPGLPIIWPDATHAKKPSTGDLFGPRLEKWKAVKDVLDFEDEGQSIFNRKKPLVDASLERIEAGLIKFVAGGKEAFLLQYNSGSTENRIIDINNPCNTIPTNNRFALAQTSFIAKYYSGKPAGKVIPVTGPAGTIKTSDGQSLVQCKPFIVSSNGGVPSAKVASIDKPSRVITVSDNKALGRPFILNTNFKNVGRSVDEPAFTLVASRRHPYVVNHCFIANYNHSSVTNDINLPAPTIVCKDKLAIINPSFLTKYHGTGENIKSINDPASTLSTKDRLAKVQPIWFDKAFTGNANIQSVENPAGTLMPVDKHHLVNCSPIILNPSHGGHCTATDVPCVTIIARQDKAPLYLIQFQVDHNINIPIYEDDSPVMVRIKQFMAIYGIADIKMRMLKVSELLPIQGFPVNYQLAGNQTDQKKFIGNSVVPQVVKAWCECMSDKIIELLELAA